MKSLYPLFSLAIGLSSCAFQPPEPEPAVLPEITMEGLNTFGCSIGEKIYEARPSGFTLPIDAYLSDNRIILNTWDRILDEEVSLQIIFPSSPFNYGPGEYYIFSENPILGLNTQISLVEPDQAAFNILYSETAKLTILALDSDTRIFAAQFEFQVRSETNDTLNVTKGRFDVILN